MEKYVKDGMTAVLVSRGFGAGWSSWGSDDSGKAMAMDRDLVHAFLEGGVKAVVKVASEKYPDNYLGGANKLVVEWVPVGTAFEIREYDGAETLYLPNEVHYWVA